MMRIAVLAQSFLGLQNVKHVADVGKNQLHIRTIGICFRILTVSLISSM